MSHMISHLLEVVRSNEKVQIDFLKRLVNIPTCCDKKHNMEPIISELTKEFEKRGYEVKVFPTSGSPVLVAELNMDKKKTLLFYNHYDVQPEDPVDEWVSPPYGLTLKDERLYGRGTADNKGPLVANIFGIQAMHDAGHEPHCNIRFIIEGEEEIGSLHLKEFCENHPELLKAEGCIWENALAVPNERSWVISGVKGCVYFELRAKGVHIDAHSADAPVVVNPAWRLTWALATLKNPKEEILINGFYDDVVPPKKEELELFESYPPEMIELYKKEYQTEKFLLGRDGVEFWKELRLKPTCNICGLSSGWQGAGTKTIVPREAMAKVDFRIVPYQKVEKIATLVRNHLDQKGFSDIESELVSGYEPSKTPITHPFIRLVARVAKDVCGKEALLIPSSPGSGPAYLFGPNTPFAMCDSEDTESRVHAPNESIRLIDFQYSAAFVAAIALEL